MATLILQAIGSAIAGPIGAAIGAIAGTVIDRAIIGGPNVQREGPRLTDLTVQNSSYGEAWPLTYGTVRIAGNIIWSSGLVERRSEQTQGGKSGSVTTTSYSYFASFAVALAGREIADVKRVWADGKLLRTQDGTMLPGGQMRLYRGSEDQMPDTLIEAAVGLQYAPAHRGAAYVVFDELPLADFANRIPNLTFEIAADTDQAGTSLDIIIDDVLARCNLRQREVRHGLASLQGFVISREASGRSIIEALAPLQSLSLSDNDGTLSVTPVVHDAAVHVFDAGLLGADIASRKNDQNADERKLDPATNLPDEIQVRYADPLRDYQINMQRARRMTARTQIRQTIDLPAVLSADRAKQMAEQLLAKLWRERQKRQIRLPMSHVTVRPGETIRFSDRLHGYWLVQSAALEDGGVSIGLVPLNRADLASVAVADSGEGSNQNPAPHGPSLGYLLDVPPIENALPTAARLFAVAAGSSSGWRRASVWLSTDQGQSYGPAATLTRATVMGSIALPPGPSVPGIWDERSSIEVELLNPDMQLFSRPEAAILAGGNLALVGKELLHFRQATALSGQRYRLRGLLRGVRGTEGYISDHTLNEPFVLLDPLPDVFAVAPLAAVDQLLASKSLSPGQGLGDVAAQSALLRGAALRPLSPVHGRHSLLANGDREIKWIRRSRGGFEWLDGIDAPLAESSEQYRLTIKVGADIRRTLDVSQSSWTYPANLAAADAVGPGVGHIDIAQLSAAIGAGTDLRLNF
jgi:Putative phage tail protein